MMPNFRTLRIAVREVRRMERKAARATGNVRQVLLRDARTLYGQCEFVARLAIREAGKGKVAA